MNPWHRTQFKYCDLICNPSLNNCVSQSLQCLTYPNMLLLFLLFVFLIFVCYSSGCYGRFCFSKWQQCYPSMKQVDSCIHHVLIFDKTIYFAVPATHIYYSPQRLFFAPMRNPLYPIYYRSLCGPVISVQVNMCKKLSPLLYILFILINVFVTFVQKCIWLAKNAVIIAFSYVLVF